MDFRLGFGAVVRRGHGDRRDRPRRARARAPAPGRGGALRRRWPATLRRAARRGARGGRRTRARGSRRCATARTSAARARGAPSSPTTARRCTRCGSTRELRAGPRPRRDRHRRRRRLRLLRRARHRLLRAGLLARSRARSAASGCGPGLRAGREARAPRTARSCCCSATARSASAAWSSTRSPATACHVVGVIGNNGIWGLEKHPMEFLYGYSVVADLRPGDALRRGRRGARRPRRARRAARRTCGRRSSARSRPGGPALVNVLTDPAVAYPRRSNLA